MGVDKDLAKVASTKSTTIEVKKAWEKKGVSGDQSRRRGGGIWTWTTIQGIFAYTREPLPSAGFGVVAYYGVYESLLARTVREAYEGYEAEQEGAGRSWNHQTNEMCYRSFSEIAADNGSVCCCCRFQFYRMLVIHCGW